MIPPKVRSGVLARARGRCEDCGERLPLELHHLRYHYQPDPRYPFTEPIDGHETPDDLAALCRDHHHGRHIDGNGDFWRDPEAMEDFWFGYYWAMDKPDKPVSECALGVEIAEDRSKCAVAPCDACVAGVCTQPHPW